MSGYSENELYDISLGNPGAITVIAQLLRHEREDLIETLHDSNLKGSALWVLYSDLCNQDIEEMIEMIDESLEGVLASMKEHGYA